MSLLSNTLCRFAIAFLTRRENLSLLPLFPLNLPAAIGLDAMILDFLKYLVKYLPFTSWQIDGETVETVAEFILGVARKSLQMVTAAMKLKGTYSLEGKL